MIFVWVIPAQKIEEPPFWLHPIDFKNFPIEKWSKSVLRLLWGLENLMGATVSGPVAPAEAGKAAFLILFFLPGFLFLCIR
jgi:hypothetical protein